MGAPQAHLPHFPSVFTASPSCSSRNLPKSIPASRCRASRSGLLLLFLSHLRGFHYHHIQHGIHSPPAHTHSSCLPSATACITLCHGLYLSYFSMTWTSFRVFIEFIALLLLFLCFAVLTTRNTGF